MYICRCFTWYTPKPEMLDHRKQKCWSWKMTLFSQMGVLIPIPTSNGSHLKFLPIQSNQWAENGLSFVALLCIFLITKMALFFHMWTATLCFFYLPMLLAHFCINLHCYIIYRSSLYILLINSLAVPSWKYSLPFGCLILLLSLLYISKNVRS